MKKKIKKSYRISTYYKCRDCGKQKTQRAFLKEWSPDCRNCIKLKVKFYLSLLEKELKKK